MSIPFSEELLSAYLDGEATPEEAALVERQLAETPELREKLNDFAEQAAALREAAWPSAPPDFATSLLAALPSDSPDAASLHDHVASAGPVRAMPRPVPVTVGRSSPTTSIPSTRVDRTPRRAIWGSAVSVALVLFLGLFVIWSPRTGPQFDHASAPVNAERFLLVPDGSIPGRTATPSTGVPQRLLPMAVRVDRDAIASELRLLADSPQVGDELSFLVTEQATPMLVDFTVVDVQQSLGQLQVLLRNHSSRQIAVNGNVPGQAISPSEQLIAVLVDLDAPEFERVLSQVDALDAVVFITEQDGSPEDSLQSTPDGSPRSRAADREQNFNFLAANNRFSRLNSAENSPTEGLLANNALPATEPADAPPLLGMGGGGMGAIGGGTVREPSSESRPQSTGDRSRMPAARSIQPVQETANSGREGSSPRRPGFPLSPSGNQFQQEKAESSVAMSAAANNSPTSHTLSETQPMLIQNFDFSIGGIRSNSVTADEFQQLSRAGTWQYSEQAKDLSSESDERNLSLAKPSSLRSTSALGLPFTPPPAPLPERRARPSATDVPQARQVGSEAILPEALQRPTGDASQQPASGRHAEAGQPLRGPQAAAQEHESRDLSRVRALLLLRSGAEAETPRTEQPNR